MIGGGDCSAMMSVGPFTLAKGDTQMIAYALIAAQDIDRLQSVERLRYVAKYCRTYYGIPTTLPVESSILPYDVSLSQNYPNPFNTSTTINYSLSINSSARLEVFDVLGRKVATLVDEQQNPGLHTAHFDLRTSHHAVSPGVYVYRLYADKMILTKKMIVTQ